LRGKKQRKKKKKRRKEQELNVKKKEKAKVDHKNKSLAGMQKKLQGMDPKDLPKGFEGQRSKNPEDDENNEVEEDDDEEYYRQEVGKAPDKELFDKKDGTRKRRSDFKDTRFKKKRKFGGENTDPAKKKFNSGGDKFGKNNDKFGKKNDKFGKKEKFQFRKFWNKRKFPK